MTAHNAWVFWSHRMGVLLTLHRCCCERKPIRLARPLDPLDALGCVQHMGLSDISFFVFTFDFHGKTIVKQCLCNSTVRTAIETSNNRSYLLSQEVKRPNNALSVLFLSVKQRAAVPSTGICYCSSLHFFDTTRRDKLLRPIESDWQFLHSCRSYSLF